MVNFFSSRLTELVLLITLANCKFARTTPTHQNHPNPNKPSLNPNQTDVIGDSAGTEGLDVNPAWVFYALYSLHNRLPRALSLTIVIGAATIITDIIFFAVNAPNLRGAAITFGVYVLRAQRARAMPVCARSHPPFSLSLLAAALGSSSK